MVTVMSNSGVGVSKKKLANSLLEVNISGSPVVAERWMEGSEKVYFSTEKPTIYRKSLEDLPEILLIP